jgi:hypothetical protein
MTDSSRVPPGSITTVPSIKTFELQTILNPNNNIAVQVPVDTGLTITVNVEAEYTAIEVTGENIVIPEAYYIPVDSNVLTQLVSFHFDYILSEFGLRIVCSSNVLMLGTVVIEPGGTLLG